MQVKTVFQAAIEDIHEHLGPELDAFEGDTRPFVRSRADLEKCLVGQMPAVLSLYALLGLVAKTGCGWARLRQWSRPGRWRPHSDGAGPARSVTLPAYAVLAWEDAGDGRVDGRYLLVADTGGLSPVALRRQLVGLVRLAATTALAVPTVVIATTSERRVRAWWVLLDKVTSSSRYASRLHVEVATWESWAARVGVDPPMSRVDPDRADGDDALLSTLSRRDFERATADRGFSCRVRSTFLTLRPVFDAGTWRRAIASFWTCLVATRFSQMAPSPRCLDGRSDGPGHGARNLSGMDWREWLSRMNYGAPWRVRASSSR